MSTADRIEELGALNTAELRSAWRRVLKTAPPPLGHDLLRRALAWHMQAKAHGALPARLARELDRLAMAGGEGTSLSLMTGTRLVRKWKGRTVHVTVLDQGYLFEDRHYRSLSQIAREVTGAHWSGPRFFGLVARSNSLSGRAPVEGGSHAR